MSDAICPPKQDDNSVQLLGGCSCGNIRLHVKLSKPANGFGPRDCDCSFCRKHGAMYLSDPNGSLQIQVNDTALVGEHRQGPEGQANFMFCKCCGVLTNVLHKCAEDGRLIGAVNSRAMNKFDKLFAEPVTVSPKLLTIEEKLQRWKMNWFGNVVLTNTTDKS